VGNNGVMRYLELTLPTAAENLALDEALLEEAETASAPLETLRVWECPETVVVVGRSSQLRAEVDLSMCEQLGIPILRRPSGGGAVVLGPGCMMYALVLSRELRPALRRIDDAHAYVLERMVTALADYAPGIERAGTSDLVLVQGNSPNRQLLKCSGNAVRVKRRHLLYHGTLLYDFPMDRIASCLLIPPRMPEYRAGRSHDRFLMNLPIARETLCSLLPRAWSAEEGAAAWPQARTAQLTREKYCQATWNAQR